MRHFYLALSLLTRIPVPSLDSLAPADFGRSALYYPLAGLLIGILLCVPVWLFGHAEPILLAAIVTVLWAALTGGLHLDGVADSADAWLGGLGDDEKTHRILKDPLVGAAGVIAVTGILLLKFAALTVLIGQQAEWLIVFAPVLGRADLLLLFMTTPYVRAGGLAGAVTDFLPYGEAILIVAAILMAGWVLAWQGIVWFLLGFWALRRLMMQRLRGCTGDTAGASVEIGEVLWLVGVALI